MRFFLRWMKRASAPAAAAIAAIALLSPASPRADEVAAEKPLPAAVEATLILSEIAPEAPVYIRVFKEESELEVWKARPNGRYALIKTFPVCNWGGTLGPKQALGDRMSPEGFYGVTQGALKPDSKYHLAFNIGYPNALDRALGRTGDFIMVHGNCVSVGCFAMSDKLIEEVYAFVRDALAAGETRVPVHVFPFRMTDANMRAHSDNPARATWWPLKQAYDDFATTREPPEIGMCSKRYVVNSLTPVGNDPNAACPPLIGRRLAPLSPRTAKRLVKADPDLEAEGQKLRSEQTSWSLGTAFGDVTFAWGSEVKAASPPRARSDADLGAVKPLTNP